MKFGFQKEGFQKWGFSSAVFTARAAGRMAVPRSLDAFIDGGNMADLLTELAEIQYCLRFFSKEDLAYELLDALAFDRADGLNRIDGLVEHAEELIAALKKLKTLFKGQ